MSSLDLVKRCSDSEEKDIESLISDKQRVPLHKKPLTFIRRKKVRVSPRAKEY